MIQKFEELYEEAIRLTNGHIYPATIKAVEIIYQVMRDLLIQIVREDLSTTELLIYSEKLAIVEDLINQMYMEV